MQWRNPRVARNVFLWPALIVVLVLAVFPLVASLVLSFSFFSFSAGGFTLKPAGLANFQNILTGPGKVEFLGLMKTPNVIGWVVFIGSIALIVWALIRTARAGKVSIVGLVLRAIGGVIALGFAWLFCATVLGNGGRPGTLTVTIIYATVGTSLQFLIGLGLAMLTVQKLPGQRFFRIVFLLPITITPVGVAYMFRLITDTQKGPFTPLWRDVGLSNFSLIADPWGARAAVIISDVWQWIPFMYIVLLAALEGRDQETEEAALVDGAGRWQIFRFITFPYIVPVSATVILIRMIEAFKIIDLPNVLTNGGPGTATESVTLQSYLAWRGFDLGQSAALAYTLLIVVTLLATAYAALVIRRTHAQAVAE